MTQNPIYRPKYEKQEFALKVQELPRKNEQLTRRAPHASPLLLRLPAKTLGRRQVSFAGRRLAPRPRSKAEPKLLKRDYFFTLREKRTSRAKIISTDIACGNKPRIELLSATDLLDFGEKFDFVLQKFWMARFEKVRKLPSLFA